jgi:murein DD-endopeptidase MepM/ murein hydrolase activator NlpD
MPGTGIWLPSDQYLQTQGQIWLQDQQQRIQSGHDWIQQQLAATQQQLQGMVTPLPSPAAPPEAPPAPVAPPPVAPPASTPTPPVSVPTPVATPPPEAPAAPSAPTPSTTAATAPQMPQPSAMPPPVPEPTPVTPATAMPQPDMASAGADWASQQVQNLLGSASTALQNTPASTQAVQNMLTPLQPGGLPGGLSSGPPGSVAQPAPPSVPSAPGALTGPQPATPGDLIDQARQAAAKYGIDPEIFTRQIQQESQFNPNARSPAGAIGIGQFMPSTAQGLGIDPTNPQQSLDAAAKLDAQNLQKYGGNWASALSAYNAGPGNTPAGGVAPFAETQSYVNTILGGANNVVQQGVQGAQQAGSNAKQTVAGQADTSGMVFPVVGYQGQINDHWGEVKGGSDIMADRGTPVVAMEAGKVLESGYNKVGGNSVLIQGDDGNQYYYAHFDQAPSVKVGDNINAGTFLGPVGNTGDASGGPTHLHIGIGPSILLGADKYGGTGGDYDAVGMLRSVLSGSQGSGQATNTAAAGPQALVTPTSPVTAPLTYAGNQPVTSPAVQDLRAGLGELGGLLPDITQFLKPPAASSPLSRVVGGQPIGTLSPTDQAQALLDWTRGYEAARSQAVQNVNPLANVPLVGGLTSNLTDPLQLALFGAAAPVGGALGGALGGGVLGGTADIATQGALGNALTAAIQPDATPTSITSAAAQGALLGGGLGAAGQAIPAATDLLGSLSAQDLLRSRLPAQSDVNVALGGLPGALGIGGAPADLAAGEAALRAPSSDIASRLPTIETQAAPPPAGGGLPPIAGEPAPAAAGGPPEIPRTPPPPETPPPPPPTPGEAVPQPDQAQLGPVTWADRLRLFHTGGAISDLATLSKVAMNSVLNPMWSFGTRSLADVAGLSGLAPGLSSGEAFGRLQGGVLGAQSGLAGIGDALAQGLSDVYRNPTSIANRANNPLDQIFGRMFETPGALHSALQQAGQNVLEQMELGRLAGQQAASEGLTGQAFMDRYGQLMNDPLPGWQDSVTGMARRAVLRGDLGTFGSMLGNLAGQGAGAAGTPRAMLGNILFPVFRVGMNALTQGVEKSPLGLGGTLFDVARGMAGAGPYAGGAFENPVGQMVAGRMTQPVAPLSERLTNNLIGTAITAWLAQKAVDGVITGAGPSDPDQRRLLMQSGWQPNSIMTPWGYASYQGTPLEVPAGLAGALGDALHNPVQPLERQEPVSEMIAGRLLGNTVDMLGSRTGLETIGQLVDMMHAFKTDPAQAMRQYGTGMVAGTLGSYVPMSGLLRGVARATDVSMRQPPPGDIGQALEANIPGLRQQVMPELSNVSGQPIPNPQQGLAAFLPTRLAAGSPGAIETSMAAAGVAPSAVPQTINYGPYDQIRLTPDERQTWQQYRGALMTRMAGDLVQSPGFQSMSAKSQQVSLQRINQLADQYAGQLLTRDIGPTARAAGRLEPTGLLAPVQGFDLGGQLTQQSLARSQMQHQALMQALLGGQTGQQYLQDYNQALASGLI